MQSKGLTLTFLIIGISCSISQVLLVREFMIIFFGNELTIGIMFVNWLLCIAIGSWGLGRLADRLTRRLDFFVITLILTSIVLPFQIFFVRWMGGWMGERGEMIGILSTFYSTFLVLLPFCSLHGFLFVLGSKLFPAGGEEPSIQISKVYVLESLGSVIGGIAFTYLIVHHLRVLEISIGLSLLNLVLALILFLGNNVGEKYVVSKVSERFSRARRLLTGIVILLIVMAGYSVLSGELSALESASYLQQWRGLELIHYQNSIYGNLVVTQSNGQIDLWVNGLPFFTAPDPDIAFVEEVVHFPMLQHPSPGKILLIGGGLAGVLEEILKHPAQSVTYLELDPIIVELVKRYYQPASEVLEDPRVEVTHMDGRLFVKGTKKSFDVVIINLPPPSTLQLNRFYTLEFFIEIREVLEEDGILSISLPSSLSHLSEEMRSRNKCVYDTIRKVFSSCIVVPGDYNIFMASPSSRVGVLTYEVETLTQRLQERGLETKMFTKNYIRYKFSPERKEIGLAYLDQKQGEINRDMRPVAVYHDLALWNTMFYPYSKSLFNIISNIDLWRLIVPLGPLILFLLIIQRRVKFLRTPIYLAIFTTGIAGMTFSIISLYAFQALCGYLYQELGLVSAAFMFGLAIGGWFMSSRVSKLGGGVPTLANIEFLIVAYALLSPVVLRMVSPLTKGLFILWLIRVVLPMLNCVAGFLVGLEFPLASSICLRGSDRVGRVAGALYASDLFGGCAGALMSSIWLIPLFGVQGALLFIVALKAGSFLLLFNFLKIS